MEDYDEWTLVCCRSRSWRISLREMFWQASTPASIRHLSQAVSPNFPHSSIEAQSRPQGGFELARNYLVHSGN